MGGFIPRSAQRYGKVSLPFWLLEKLGMETEGSVLTLTLPVFQSFVGNAVV